MMLINLFKISTVLVAFTATFASGAVCDEFANLRGCRRARRRNRNRPKRTARPTPSPTPNPTASSTASPTPSPTPMPTPSPTPMPTASPTPSPTPMPTTSPTPMPTVSPTPSPTTSPTPSPTSKPTTNPVASPASIPVPLLLEVPEEMSYHQYGIVRFELEETTPPLGMFACQYDGGEWIDDCQSPWVIMPNSNNVAAGVHSFSVRYCLENGDCGEQVGSSWTVESVVALALSNDTLLGQRVQTTSAVTPDYGTGGGADTTPFIQGIFRIQCLEVTNMFADPIVFFGQENTGHLHSFWGNRNINPHTTDEMLFTGVEDTYVEPRSACQGEDINRSGYWVPTTLAPVYTSDNIFPERSGWSVVRKDNDINAIAAGLFHETFYYSAVVADVHSIQRPPVGLRMVAGNPSATPQNPADNLVLNDPNYKAHWYCAIRGSANGFNGLTFTNYIPECAYSEDGRGRPNMLVHYVVRFPSCWDGVNLDSDDHQSHVAYPVFKTEPGSGLGKTIACPDSHPIPFPEVSNHFSFTVEESNMDPVTRSSKGWRLSSDNYVVGEDSPGGHSLHGDWINGWHPEVFDAMIEGCLHGKKDCHNGELGSPASANGQFLVLDSLDNASVPQPAYAPDLTNSDMAGMAGTLAR